MTAPELNQQQPQEAKQNDKEHNFRALEAKMMQERNARLEAERRVLEAERMLQERQAQSNNRSDEDEEDDQPYVDHKRLNKSLASFEKRMEMKIDQKAEEKARRMMDENKKTDWLRRNPDFYDVLQHAEKFAQEAPDLAETILEMPEGFERQKLVYSTIKRMGIDKPMAKQPSIQEKIDSNRKSPYYQPSGVGAAPYAAAGDYSASGQKNAYQKMQELKNKLRI
jgi:hypothetical protein